MQPSTTPQGMMMVRKCFRRQRQRGRAFLITQTTTRRCSTTTWQVGLGHPCTQGLVSLQPTARTSFARFRVHTPGRMPPDVAQSSCSRCGQIVWCCGRGQLGALATRDVGCAGRWTFDFVCSYILLLVDRTVVVRIFGPILCRADVRHYARLYRSGSVVRSTLRLLHLLLLARSATSAPLAKCRYSAILPCSQAVSSQRQQCYKIDFGSRRDRPEG